MYVAIWTTKFKIYHLYYYSGPQAQEKNQVVVLRMFANLFATERGEKLMIENFKSVCS